MTPASQRKPLYAHLYFQVLLAIAIGVALGYFRPTTGAAMKPFGDGFIKLIKMMIAPVVFTTVTLGIAKAGDMRKVGRVGLKAIVYFEVISTIALIIGLIVVNVVRPGAGLNADPNTLQQPKELTDTLASGKNLTTVDLILRAIPDSAIGAFTGGEILQVLVVSILFGLALGRFGEAGKSLLDLLDRFSHVLFGMISLIMYLAPIGAFGAMAFTIGKYGIGALLSLGKLMGCVYLTCILFVFVVLGIVARVSGFSLWQFLRYIKEEILLVLGTSSSETALPRMISKLENVGCAKSVVGLVIPTGYSFNLDGTSIYLTMAAIFVAQATNVPLSLGQQLGILGVLLLTSKGAAAVTGAGFITLAATLQSTGKVPVAGLALIFGIDRFMSEARSITNLIGNGVATMAVARWEGALDLARARAVLAADTDLAAEAPEALSDARAGFAAVPLEQAAVVTEVVPRG